MRISLCSVTLFRSVSVPITSKCSDVDSRLQMQYERKIREYQHELQQLVQLFDKTNNSSDVMFVDKSQTLQKVVRTIAESSLSFDRYEQLKTIVDSLEACTSAQEKYEELRNAMKSLEDASISQEKFEMLQQLIRLVAPNSNQVNAEKVGQLELMIENFAGRGTALDMEQIFLKNQICEATSQLKERYNTIRQTEANDETLLRSQIELQLLIDDFTKLNITTTPTVDEMTKLLYLVLQSIKSMQVENESYRTVIKERIKDINDELERSLLEIATSLVGKWSQTKHNDNS